MKLRWARSATKHRISRERSGRVVRSAATIVRLPAPASATRKDDRLLFLGADSDGQVLEVMAVETQDGLLVIHAMPLRPKYADYVKEERHD